jgi:hypothetical protein
MQFCLVNTMREPQADEERLTRWQRVCEMTWDYECRSYYCRVLRIGLFKITSFPEPGMMLGPKNYRGFHLTVRIYLPWLEFSRWR